MSHFTVLVSATDREHLDEVLLPYHEYECTGIEEYTEFVVEVPYNEIPATANDLRKEYSYDDNMDDLDILRDWYGGELREEGWGRLTNPNAKWDWYQVGGRWTGSLRLKKNQVIVSEAGDGSPGLMTSANVDHKYCDYAPAGEIDWYGMADEWRGRRRSWYGKRQMYYQLARNQEPPTQVVDKTTETYYSEHRSYLREILSLDDYVLHAHAQEIARKDKDFWWDNFDDIAKSFLSPDEFDKTLFTAKAQSYAFIDLEGNWNQRGEMGWFGMDDPEQGTPDYDRAWWDFVESLPDDQMVFMVDCHI